MLTGGTELKGAINCLTGRRYGCLLSAEAVWKLSARRVERGIGFLMEPKFIQVPPGRPRPL